jgi:hypothetical protein
MAAGTPATSAPGLGPPLPTSAPGLGQPHPQLHRDRTRPTHARRRMHAPPHVRTRQCAHTHATHAETRTQPRTQALAHRHAPTRARPRARTHARGCRRTRACGSKWRRARCGRTACRTTACARGNADTRTRPERIPRRPPACEAALLCHITAATRRAALMCVCACACACVRVCVCPRPRRPRGCALACRRCGGSEGVARRGPAGATWSTLKLPRVPWRTSGSMDGFAARATLCSSRRRSCRACSGSRSARTRRRTGTRCARPAHVCAGIGLTPATSAPRLG